ncbi:alpha,alpha-trehalose-phosphate synthase (UDP-forming) [Desulfocurvus sp. DL9XJH121]
MRDADRRLVVVSNRLPIVLERTEDGYAVSPGKGGLVTALAPVLRNRGGDWIGWSGVAGDVDIGSHLLAHSRAEGYDLHAVSLTEDEVRDFYQGFANEVIWPLFHDMQALCAFRPEYYEAYLGVNRKFATVVGGAGRENSYIWVHDYHLMHLARCLREEGCSRRCGFFLHIPFPPPDIFLRLPWRAEIIRALLEFDLVGFQTLRDRRNFQQCVGHLCPEVKLSGRGPVITARHGRRTVRVGYFPISIDFKDFQSLARTRKTADLATQVHAAFRHRPIVLGADRLDYSKGIPERIEAMRTLFTRYPEMRGTVSLVQVVVPSREAVKGYKAMKLAIEGLVSEVNGRFSEPGWVPIHYLYRNLSRAELVAYYRLADVALVTPLKDGMNLVAKEYCACSVTGEGVLVLSEFAGAAAQLQRWALLVNPHDYIGVADALHRALTMDRAERRERMHRLRTSIRKYDIYWWVNAFLEAAFGRRLGDFQLESVDFHSQR